MEVAHELTVVELNGHCVMRVLIDGPHTTEQVQAKVPPVAAPRGAARLKGLVDLWAEVRGGRAALTRVAVTVIAVVIDGIVVSSLAVTVHAFLGITGAIVIIEEAVVRPLVWAEDVVKGVGGAAADDARRHVMFTAYNTVGLSRIARDVSEWVVDERCWLEARFEEFAILAFSDEVCVDV